MLGLCPSTSLYFPLHSSSLFFFFCPFPLQAVGILVWVVTVGFYIKLLQIHHDLNIAFPRFRNRTKISKNKGGTRGHHILAVPLSFKAHRTLRWCFIIRWLFQKGRLIFTWLLIRACIHAVSDTVWSWASAHHLHQSKTHEVNIYFYTMHSRPCNNALCALVYTYSTYCWKLPVAR